MIFCVKKNTCKTVKKHSQNRFQLKMLQLDFIPKHQISDGDAPDPVKLVHAAVRRHDESVDDEQHDLLVRLAVETLVRLSTLLAAHYQT